LTNPVKKAQNKELISGILHLFKGGAMLKSDTTMFNQYQGDGRRHFFKALQEGEFSKALAIMEAFKIDPDTKGGLLSASALFYVATSEDLEPALTETLLKKGANPNVKDTGFVQKKTVLEEVIHTGFYYYTCLRMHPALERNLLQTIALLAAFGGTCREDLFEMIEKSPIAYDEEMNYCEFKASILKAIRKGQMTYEQRQEEKGLIDASEHPRPEVSTALLKL